MRLTRVSVLTVLVVLSTMIAVNPARAHASCTPASKTAVTVCTPTANATLGSPVTVTASTNSSPAAQYMQIYVDNQLQYTTHTTSLSASIAMTAGKHYLVVQAYNGGFMKTPLYVTITAPPKPSISISPGSATVMLSGTQQFTASVTGESSTAVSWAVDGTAGGNATAGTITANGLYTAPATAGTHTVTATSDADATLTASATLAVANQPPSSCTPASTTAVTVCTPTPNATLGSPVTVAASTNSSPAAQYMQIYVDNQLQYTTHTTSLSTGVPMTAGKHYLVVQAYNGGFMKTPLYVTISTSTQPTIAILPGWRR